MPRPSPEHFDTNKQTLVAGLISAIAAVVAFTAALSGALVDGSAQPTQRPVFKEPQSQAQQGQLLPLPATNRLADLSVR